MNTMSVHFCAGVREPMRRFLFFRYASFIHRRARLRSTAFRTLRLTEKPIRTEFCGLGAGVKKHLMTPCCRDFPSIITREKVWYPRRISCFFRDVRGGFTARCESYFSSLTVRRRRPFALRRERTFRPFFVAMRALKPCLFVRLRRCGW